MHGIFTYISHKKINQHVGKYTIHGSSGYYTWNPNGALCFDWNFEPLEGQTDPTTKTSQNNNGWIRSGQDAVIFTFQADRKGGCLNISIGRKGRPFETGEP